MNKYNIKQVEVAKETGIHHSSLSLWLQGKIKGHMVKISESIESYLENFMSNKPRMNTPHISKLNLLKAPNNKFEDEYSSLDAAFNNGFGTLIPIKLDIEIDGKKLKEQFLWDKNEPYLTLESFAKILIEEHNLPAPLFELEIVNAMRKQINAVFRTNTAPYRPTYEGESIRIVKLNVRIGMIIVRDQFEWDINNPKNSPEDFAETLCADLGLGSEFLLPIAIQIREQILEYQRTAHQDKRMMTYYNKNNMIMEAQYQSRGIANSVAATTGQQSAFGGNTYIRSIDEIIQPVLPTGAGQKGALLGAMPGEEQFYGWAPEVQVLTENDLRKIEKQEERKARYEKRRR